MNLFTTRQLLGYTEQKVKFNPLFLTLFFRRTVTFKEQEVMLDKITGKTPIAAYVSPVVGGKVLRNRGGETRVLRPGYVKPKHEVNYSQVVERLPGGRSGATERPGLPSSAYSDRQPQAGGAGHHPGGGDAGRQRSAERKIHYGGRAVRDRGGGFRALSGQ